MSLLTWVLVVLLVWLLLLVVLIGLFVVAKRWPRRRRAREVDAEQSLERRRGGDRRIGLPDTRAVPIERRRGWDRRGQAAA